MTGHAIKSQQFNRVVMLIEKIDSVEGKRRRFTTARARVIRDRKGLEDIPWLQLEQYRSYLKGFYFHAFQFTGD